MDQIFAYRKATHIVFGFALAVLCWFGISSVNSFEISAQTKNYSLDRVDVVVDVNKDSSMNVSEKLSYTFNDEMNGMFREITLTDKEDLERCRQNPALQCGGFSLIKIDRVLVNGEEVPFGRYEVLETSNILEDRLRVQYEFDNAPVELNNKKYTFQVDYTVLGGIGFFDDYDLFYWNAIFEDRDKVIGKATVKVNYPVSVKLDVLNSNVFSLAGQDYTYDQSKPGHVEYETKNLQPYYDFTILQKVKKGAIKEPANVKFKLDPDEQTFVYGEFEAKVSDGQVLNGIIPGETEVVLKKGGYKSQTKVVNFESGKETLLDVKLEPTLLTRFLYFAIIAGNVFLCLFGLAAPVLIFLYWFWKGRDDKSGKTIIPEFSPPDDMKPYLLGSLKDEKVDNVDISSTIIDLAYRGYIKIIEMEKKFLGKQDYTLEKLKEIDDLDETEQAIMNMLFSVGDSVKLSSLKYKAYTDVAAIKDGIYAKMVGNGYFKKNPQKTRTKWGGFGTALLVTGIFISFPLAGAGIFTGFCFALMAGISLIIGSFYMPSKTRSGSEVLRHIRGFKMYLETAEKHTLQKLTPKLFEKYLSYAVVFGVEKQWANTFKDIYKGSPDWYSSRSGNFNTVLFVNSLHNFNNSAATTVTSSPSSSGSSSGGGWSGGGGFSGGFSGGGGGGGGGGAW